MKILNYHRETAVDYAKKWAFLRNPNFYNFDSVGGDCTSFVSQCLYAGSKTMNFSSNGWFYNNGYNKSPSWSGVEFLYQFLINNKSVGPFATKTDINTIKKADIIQLSFDGKTFAHSLFVVDVIDNNITRECFVASHSDDSYYRNLFTYNYQKARFLSIAGVRTF